MNPNFSRFQTGAPTVGHLRLLVDVPHLPRILGAEVFEPDVSERLTVGVAMGLGVSVTGGTQGSTGGSKTGKAMGNPGENQGETKMW